ncbi:hypothetical protein [uncultured Victivallis sp.]|nr:hypothetical protein [uncultured Victivallis sp.]
MDGWYGERRGLSCRFLSPEPLSCSAGRWNALPSDEWKVNYFHHLKFN